MPFLLLALSLIAVDQWSKWLVTGCMAQGQSIPVIERIFYLTYVRNPGAAFGMLPYKTAFFVLVTIMVVLGILIFLKRIPKGKVLLKAGLALQVGGAVGNLIDRIRFGQVIDFLDFRVWPVFNLADVGIVIGVGILFLELVKNNRSREKRGGPAVE